MSGDGCFYVSIYKSLTTKTGIAVALRIVITQHKRDIELLKYLIKIFEIGRIDQTKNSTSVVFVVTKYKDIKEKIIPLFDNYPLHGIKLKNYVLFKKIVEIIEKKLHTTQQGLFEIRKIKSKINL